VQAAVDRFMHPDVTLPARANDVALGRKPKAPKQAALKRSQISTLVLNGTTILGLARDTSYKLAVAGFRTSHLPAPQKADAPSASYYANYVYFDSVQPHSSFRKRSARTRSSRRCRPRSRPWRSRPGTR
jgi:hypothetical protein